MIPKCVPPCSPEDFNKQILSPDVSQSEFVELHNAAKDLYRTYVAPDALDRIKFDEEVVAELRDSKSFLSLSFEWIVFQIKVCVVCVCVCV